MFKVEMALSTIGDEIPDHDPHGEDDYPHSDSDTTELEDYEDSDYDDDNDDLLFEANIDRNVEWAGLGSQKGKNVEVVDTNSNQLLDGFTWADDEAVSDELHSLSGSSDEDEGPKRVKYPEFNVQTDMVNPQFKVGMIFASPKVLKEAIKEHAIKTGKNIKFIKNDSTRVRAGCKPPCQWLLHASKMQGQLSFQVKTYKPIHNCGRIYYNKHVDSNWLSKKYVQTIKSNPTWPLQSFRETVQKDHKVGVSRSKLYRAKRKAQELIEGSLMEQYASLWDYCEEIRRTNPGTTIILKTTENDEDNSGKERFERIYVCLGALKQGFVAGCRPFIGVDGCHLKGPYKGQLLTAVGVDGNNNSYALAYAVVEGETKSSWKWFFEILREDIGSVHHQGLTFMSDKQKGLVPALAEVIPNADHRFCVRHLHNNFQESFKGLLLKDLLWAAAKASYVQQFDQQMQQINDVDKGAFNWLAERPPTFWSRSHFTPHCKCDVVHNNMCESFNGLLVEARSKTIIPMLEDIRCLIMKRMQMRREAMRRVEGLLCPNIQKKLDKEKEESSNCIALWSGGSSYQISCFNGQQFVVDLEDHTCSCRKWDLTGIPCPHVISAIYYKHEEPEDYVAHWYRKDTYMASYEPIVYPINGSEMWPSTGQPGLLPPTVKRQPGRPKKLRKRERDEPQNPSKLKRQQTTTACSICGNLGHNKRSCKGQPMDEQSRRQKISVRKKTPVGSEDIGSQSSMGRRPTSMPTTKQSYSQPIGSNRPISATANLRSSQPTFGSKARPQLVQPIIVPRMTTFVPPTSSLNIRVPPGAFMRPMEAQPSSGGLPTFTSKGKKYVTLSSLHQAATAKRGSGGSEK